MHKRLRQKLWPDRSGRFAAENGPILCEICDEIGPFYLPGKVALTDVEIGIMPWLGGHSFRKTPASLMMSDGADVKVVQDSLRHAKPSTTMRDYAQALKQDKTYVATKVFQMIWPRAPHALAKAVKSLVPICSRAGRGTARKPLVSCWDFWWT